jgi:hypothetical protein
MNFVKGIEMNQLTPDQVIAAFETAGQLPQAPASLMASVLSAQLAATSAAFAQIPFSVEPDTFAVLLRKEH